MSPSGAIADGNFDRVLSILLVSRDVSLFADIFLRLGLKKIGHEFKQDSVDLQIFLGKL